MGRNKRKKVTTSQFVYTIVGFIIAGIIAYFAGNMQSASGINSTTQDYSKLGDVPEYTDQIYVTINENKPFFTEEEYTTKEFENYSELDVLGRCGVAYANVCKKTMPPEGDIRGDISSI